MLSEKVRQTLEMMDSRAEQEGVPRYDKLEEDLRQARLGADKHAEAELLLQMGIRLWAIGFLARARASEKRKAAQFPEQNDAFESAIRLLQDSIEIAEGIGDRGLQKHGLNRLADCCLQMERFEDALRQFIVVLDLCQMPEDEGLRFDSLQKAGDCHLQMENDEAALRYYEDALEVAKAIDDPFEVGTQLGKVASALSNLKRYEEALRHYEQSRDFMIRLENDEALRRKIILRRNSFNVQALPGIIENIDDRITHTRERERSDQAVAELPNSVGIRYRHASYYQKKLADIDRRYKEASADDKSLIIPGLDQEWEQIRKGQDWTASQLDRFDAVSSLCLRYAFTASFLLDKRIAAKERLKWNQAGLAAAERLHVPRDQSHLLREIGYNYIDLGVVDEARERLERALDISRKSNDREAEGFALIALSLLDNHTGQYTNALRNLEEGRLLVSDMEMDEDNRYLSNLVTIYQNTGDYALALREGERDLAAAQKTKDVTREAIALDNLGLIYHSQGQYSTALDYHLQSLTLSRKLGNRRGQSNSLAHAGLNYAAIEQFELAEAYYSEALAIASELNDRLLEEGCQGNLGDLYRMMGRYEDALKNYEAARLIALESCHRAGEALSLQGMATVSWKRGEHQQAVEFYTRALAIESEIGRPESQCVTLYNLGNTYATNGQFEEGLRQYNLSLDISISKGLKHREAQARLGKAMVFHLTGWPDDALGEAHQARKLFQELGLQSEMGAAEIIISMVEKARDSATPDNEKAEIFHLLHCWTRISPIDGVVSKALLLEHQGKLLTDEAETILRLIVRGEPDNRVTQRHVSLLQECRTNGIEAAYEKYFNEVFTAVVRHFDSWRETPNAKLVIGKIVEWAWQPDKASSKRFLDTNINSLPMINTILVLGLLSKDGQPETIRFQQLGELFNLCRKRGIDAAYADFDTLIWHSDMVGLVSEWIHYSLNAPVEDFLLQHEDRLLTDEAEYVISEWLRMAPNRGTEQYLRLVQNARKDGIDNAVAAFYRMEDIQRRLIEWINTGNWETKKQMMLNHSDDFLTDAAEQTMNYLVTESGGEGGRNEVHRILLRACRRDGIDAAFKAQARRNTPEYAQHISSLLLVWISLPTWEASREYLKGQSEDLLTEWAVYITKELVQKVSGMPIIEEHLKILEASLKVGIDSAYDAIKQNWRGNG